MSGRRTKATETPQQAMDEQVMDDPQLIQAVHDFNERRGEVATVTGAREKALDKVKSLIPAEVMTRMADEHLALRAGPFRIAMHDIKGGHRDFDTKDRQVMRISSPKE